MMEKPEVILVSDIADEQPIPAPKEIRNWRVYMYCIGVCMGSVALGTPFSYSPLQAHLQALFD